MPTPRKSTAKKAESKTSNRRAARQSETPQPRTIQQKRAAAMGSDAPSADEYAPTVWGTAESFGTLVDLVVPSGQKILVQKPEPTLLMREGMLDDLDSLATVMAQVSGKGRSAKEINPAHLLRNPKMVEDSVKLFDRVICAIVIKPEITPEPDRPEEKVKGKIYPSTIGLEDKSFIFNWAMGDSRGLRRFPGEPEGDLAVMATGEESDDSPE